jgi:gamma-glutamyltranspeptidase/glutathione hydrolase
MKDEVIARKGVVTANHPQAAEVGLSILEKGGNAIDAGVATGFCNTVVAPFLAGIAGQGIMLVYLADLDKTVAIDFNAKSPRKATPDLYKIVGVTRRGNNIYEVENDELRSGPKGVCVPGTAAGLCLAHELYGSLPLEKVLQPSISLAAEGFLVRPYQTDRIANMMATIQSRPPLVEMWLPNGRPPTTVGGEKVVQPDLGRLLKRISQEGSDFIYKGDVAKVVAEYIQKRGGVLDYEDLAAYEPTVGEPMEISYRDFQVMTVPAPIGGQTLLETLNILENFDTQSLGHNTSDYLHLFIECARHAFADRYRYMGDWEVAKVPIEGLLSKEYAKEISSQVDLEKAALEPRIDEEPWVYYIEKSIHDPWKYDPQTRPSGEAFSASADSSGTTHFNAVDKDRNIVCCTHFGGFGDGGFPPGTGLYLNGHMGQLIPKAGHPNSVEGWKRPMTNDSPVIVLKEGRPILCVGAPGGRRIINRITQILLSVLDFGMGIQDACAAPTVDASSMQTVVDSRIPSKTIDRLKAMGHRIRPVVSSTRVAEFARPSGILIDHDAGLLKGGVEVFAAAVALGH